MMAIRKSAGTPRRRRRRFASRGGLIVIATLMLGSAVLRLGESTGQAFALAAEDGALQPPDPALETTRHDTPETLKPLLDALQAREARVSAREVALRDRMHALKIVDEQVSQKLAALEAAEESLRQTIALAETAAEGDLARLTKVYETMKPKQAAALFEEMAPEFAAGFLGRMRPDAAAAILAGLSPDAAHRFSVVLAGRNAGAPTE